MHSFEEILDLAADRHGGPEAIAAMLPTIRPKAEVAEIPDAIWLQTMAMRIFSTGMNTKMIEAKEDDIVAAFEDLLEARNRVHIRQIAATARRRIAHIVPSL